MAFVSLSFSVGDVLTAANMNNVNGNIDLVRAFHKGPSAPAELAAGVQWLDDDTPSATSWTWAMYDGTDWITIGTFDSTANTFSVTGAFDPASPGEIGGTTEAAATFTTITTTGAVTMPASNGTGAGILKFESLVANTPHAAITAEDVSGQGTEFMIGTNLYLDSYVATRYDTGEESAGIWFQREGTINFYTGASGATAIAQWQIQADGDLYCSVVANQILAGTGTTSLPGISFRADSDTGFMDGGNNILVVAGTLQAGMIGSQWFTHDETGNANGTRGTLCLHSVAYDVEALTFKNDDIAHGITTKTETDTWTTVKKYEATIGGAWIRGYSEGETGVAIEGTYTNGNTTKTTSSRSAVTILSSKKYTTTTTNPGTSEAILNVGNGHTGPTIQFIVDAEGDLHANGGTSTTAVTVYDEYDDVDLVDDFNNFLGYGNIDALPDFKRMRKLEKLKLTGYVSPARWAKGERPLWSITKLAQLHNGWMGQAHNRERLLWSVLAQLLPDFVPMITELIAANDNLTIGRTPVLIAA